jgi:hypothetical protein
MSYVPTLRPEQKVKNVMAITEMISSRFFITTSAGRCAVTVFDYLAISILIATACWFGAGLIRGGVPKGKATVSKRQSP